jgi:hypothetical protein
LSYSSSILAYFFANKFNNIIPPITRSSKWPFFPVSLPTPNAFVFVSTILATCITHFIGIKENIYILASFLGFRINKADVSVLLDVATRCWMIDA